MIQKIRVFIGEMSAELKKVTWPSREELKESTIVVIIATLIATAFIGVVDIILNRLFRIVVDLVT